MRMCVRHILEWILFSGKEGQKVIFLQNCERFEPRSHFKRLSLIVQVNIVLNRTVVVDSD